ncbi:MAG: hypothetical protein II979_08165 [Clostridia bacterium]|nr:hypothetical protein [Clostridia bacterium]
MKTKQILAILLAALMTAGSFVSCGEKDTAETQAAADTEAAEVVETEEVDPFADMDLGGESIRMMVSSREKDGIVPSIFAIQHGEELTGEVVSDAVYNRNIEVEEMLNIKLEFTADDQSHETIGASLTQLLTAGDDAYDQNIHELFQLATLSVQNSFLNVFNIPHLDFSRDYWYDDYMSDTSFASEDKRYILAGDYFLDVYRSAHALYFNKDRFTDLYGAPEELYDLVLEGGWTHDVFLQYSEGAYQDINGDGQRDKDDLYGFSTYGYWGPIIPWVIGADITFLEYNEDGSPYFAMNNERSIKLLEQLNKIFHGEGAYDYQADFSLAFINGSSLFGGYHRVAHMENFRDMEADLGILPIPKMDDSQENYITSSHDTTNVGVIPITCSKSDIIGAVLEVLSRESAENVIPAYYETSLKTKYVRDDQSAQILDIIRQNISCVFPVAFGNYCGNLALYNAFSAPLGSKSTDFVSNYVKHEKTAQAKLDELWEAFSSVES